MNLEVANRLQQLRKAKGLSQEELANILGLSRQAISKWERAETSPDTDNLICLARLYNISIDKLLDTSESTEEIKERIAQERIDEINNKKEEIYNESNNNENNDSIDVEYKEEETIFISDEDITLTDELKESKKKKDNITEVMYSATLVLGIITWVLIGQIDKDSWKWGWVFGAMSFGFVFTIEQIFVNRTLNLVGFGLSFLMFWFAFSICVDEAFDIDRIFAYIGIGILVFQIIVQMVLYIVYFTKNRKTASELFYKEQLIEMKHKYEKEIEKLKNKLH